MRVGIDGDTGDYYITYEYSIDDDQLTIDMIRDEYPTSDPKGLLGEHYESAPFIRQS